MKQQCAIPSSFLLHAGLKKWVEVGNSGVFRPEMLLPTGLPEDVTVIACLGVLSREVGGQSFELVAVSEVHNY